MLTRHWSIVPTLIGVFLVPVSLFGSHAPHKAVSVSLAAKPIAVSVRTAMQPLDLSKFSAGDFGDAETAH